MGRVMGASFDQIFGSRLGRELFIRQDKSWICICTHLARQYSDKAKDPGDIVSYYCGNDVSIPEPCLTPESSDEGFDPWKPTSNINRVYKTGRSDRKIRLYSPSLLASLCVLKNSNCLWIILLKTCSVHGILRILRLTQIHRCLLSKRHHYRNQLEYR